MMQKWDQGCTLSETFQHSYMQGKKKKKGISQSVLICDFYS